MELENSPPQQYLSAFRATAPERPGSKNGADLIVESDELMECSGETSAGGV